MNSNYLKAVGLAVCVVARCSFGQQAEAFSAKEVLTFGGDNRTRYEFMDNWPKAGTTKPGTSYDEYFRFRTRVWGKAQINDELSTTIRLGNEFRGYNNSPLNNNRNKFPDELYLDNLYGEWKQDRYDLKIGRQGFMKGPGRVLADGTPGDGSRTAYFDGAVFTLNVSAKSFVDFMGTWNHYRDDTPIGSTSQGVYDLTKIRSGSPYSKMDEGGLVAYATVREIEALPFETYWIWKKETSFYSGEDRYPGREFHTMGVRLLPVFADWLSGEWESAYQFGGVDSAEGFKSRDISAGMVYGGLTAKAMAYSWVPSLRVGVLYMSGDKDSYYKTTDGSTDTGWNPVWGRIAYSSDIPVFMYDNARWSNLLYPHAEIAATPAMNHVVSLESGPMYAVEKDLGATDDYRGLFVRSKYTFPLPTVAGISMNGLVSGDILQYGDYFDTKEDAATSIRFELNAKF